jgi:RHS repeat-associated protein
LKPFQYTNTSGTIVAEQNFDAWGRKRNATTWDYANVAANPTWLYRGYTGHEHLSEFNLINMNARLYDPVLGRMLSPDNYVSVGGSQGMNRYTYANNNPLKYVDPDGNDPITVAIIIGASIGAYNGGVIANQGEPNPLKWDYQANKTWGYMIGGATVGAISGGVSGLIGSSGIAFSNTLSLMSGSFISSVGMNVITDGEIAPSISFGFGSLNLKTGEWDYLGKKGNKWENIGYALGALSNLSDVLAGLNPIGTVDVVTEHSDAIGHSAIVKEGMVDNTQSIVSFGPATNGVPKKDFMNPRGVPSNAAYQNHTSDKSPIWRATIRNTNVKGIERYAKWLSSRGSNYNVYTSSCVTHTSLALNSVGVFNIGIHPFILAGQMALREAGIRPLLFSYYFNQK